MTNNDTMFDEVELQDTIVEAPTPRKKPVQNRELQSANAMINIAEKQKSLVAIYRAEEKVPVRIAPSYRNYFGNTMRVSINGIVIAVKCNGKTVQVPKTFAIEIYSRMSKMDEIDLRMTCMSNVNNNFEHSAGALSFYS